MRVSWDAIIQSICITGVTRRRKKEKGAESIFEEIIDDFLDLRRDLDIQLPKKLKKLQ